ncbi:MAG: hypothetical protein PHR35_22665 [Kiritimatiellae bacterium]|nr:hypothetical protein [Kiritimatiellia bacterium]
MKAIVFRRIMAIVICLAMPALGLLLTGRPISAYLEFPPRTRHIVHAAFAWTAFAALGAVLLVPMALVVRRIVSQARNVQPRPSLRRFPAWGWLGVASGIVAWVLAWTRLPHAAVLQPYTFIPLWLAYTVVMNALAWRRTGACPLLSRPVRYAWLFPLSAVFWWYFEYLNRFVQNWFYQGVEGFSADGYVLCASLSFATVLPAVTATEAWLAGYPALTAGLGHATPLQLRHPRPAAWASLLAGALFLGLLPVFPNALFPFLWLAPLAVMAAAESLAGRATPFAAAGHGDWRPLARMALAALVCGFFWELWNYWSHARWVYAVPYVGRFHLFEMPILGYAGYLPFGIECALVADWVMRDDNAGGSGHG